MNLTDSDILKIQKGTPILLEDICAIRSVKVGEIVDLGYDKFREYLNVILLTKPPIKKNENSQLQKLTESLTDFQYVLLLTQLDKEVNQSLKEAFRFFCCEDVLFSLDPAQIIIGPLQEKHILTEEKFYDLQSILRKIYLIEQNEEEIIINENDSLAVRNLKMKMRENRERVRLAKAREAERKKNDLKFSDLIGSVTINNCGLNMVNIYDITYYAFQDQLKRMGWRDQFDINNKAALAGAKIDKNQLKHWIRSIDSHD